MYNIKNQIKGVVVSGLDPIQMFIIKDLLTRYLVAAICWSLNCNKHCELRQVMFNSSCAYSKIQRWSRFLQSMRMKVIQVKSELLCVNVALDQALFLCNVARAFDLTSWQLSP